jgi:ketosteroid isomerase-like protein
MTGRTMRLTVDDHIAIQQLYVKYAFAADMHEIENFVSCYTEDGEYVGVRKGGPHVKGHAALRAFVQANAARGENNYHVTTGPLIEPAEFGARGRCYLVNVIADDAGGVEQIRNALYYRDELVKQDGRWLFRRRATNALPSRCARSDLEQEFDSAD